MGDTYHRCSSPLSQQIAWSPASSLRSSRRKCGQQSQLAARCAAVRLSNPLTTVRTPPARHERDARVVHPARSPSPISSLKYAKAPRCSRSGGATRTLISCTQSSVRHMEGRQYRRCPRSSSSRMRTNFSSRCAGWRCDADARLLFAALD